MTTELNAQDLAQSIQDRFPGSVMEAGGNALVVSTDTLAEVARHCYEDPDLAFDFLVGVTGVDYIDTTSRSCTIFYRSSTITR